MVLASLCLLLGGCSYTNQFNYFITPYDIKDVSVSEVDQLPEFSQQSAQVNEMLERDYDTSITDIVEISETDLALIVLDPYSSSGTDTRYDWAGKMGANWVLTDYWIDSSDVFNSKDGTLFRIEDFGNIPNVYERDSDYYLKRLNNIRNVSYGEAMPGQRHLLDWIDYFSVPYVPSEYDDEVPVIGGTGEVPAVEVFTEEAPLLCPAYDTAISGEVAQVWELIQDMRDTMNNSGVCRAVIAKDSMNSTELFSERAAVTTSLMSDYLVSVDFVSGGATRVYYIDDLNPAFSYTETMSEMSRQFAVELAEAIGGTVLPTQTEPILAQSGCPAVKVEIPMSNGIVMMPNLADATIEVIGGD